MNTEQSTQDWDALKEDIAHLLEVIENNSTPPMGIPGNDNILVVRS